MIYFCCDKLRRALVEKSAFNGIDYLEVLDHDAPAGTLRQQTLLVHCLKPIVPSLTHENVQISGGERIRPVRVVWAYPIPDIPPGTLTAAEQALFGALTQVDQILAVRADSAGDYSTYRLALVQSATDPTPAANFDSQFAATDFSFKVECPSDFDCGARCVCPPPTRSNPDLDYLAKDYQSFRRLMLDRITQLSPLWTERHEADLGIALVELLAYVGDYLSYQQDAVATEAYLRTARRRISVRRHARLVDYPMHDGCNARVFVQFDVNVDSIVLPAHTPVFTQVSRIPQQMAPGSEPFQRALLQKPVVFETMETAAFFRAHGTMEFYTWADARCCLPKGATRATLAGHYPDLQPGDLLIFEEVIGPATGQPEDADRSRRCAVRLTGVTAFDPTNQPLTDPCLNPAPPITEIAWGAEDALPFPFCVSATTDEAHGSLALTKVSVARGNVVLADHGLSISGEDLGTVPPPKLFPSPDSCNRCEPTPVTPVPARYRPRLRQIPLTQVSPPFSATDSATTLLRTSPKLTTPSVTLHSTLLEETFDWTPVRDLLNSHSTEHHFVVEIESDGTTYLRFGDDELGARPDSGTHFTADYRVGNGAAGNIGADALAHVVTNVAGIVNLRNPLPATGGLGPESVEQARQYAPSAFYIQQRAVTEADYADVAQRPWDDAVNDTQRAAATFRWTGSWHTIFVTVDRLGGRPVDAGFQAAMRSHLERYRMAGHDLDVDQPRYVSLELDVHVCVLPDFFRADVKRALLEVFGNQILPDGTKGVFHPDNFTLGQPVYLSPIYAAAQAVPGVQSVTVTKFQRQDHPDDRPLHAGKLTLDRLEIARLDNDPSFPEHGVFRLDMGGGK